MSFAETFVDSVADRSDRLGSSLALRSSRALVVLALLARIFMASRFCVDHFSQRLLRRD